MKQDFLSKEYWQEINNLVYEWLTEREDLVELYNRLNGLKQCSAQELPFSIKIQAFCQILVDYVSAGHFEIYQRLLEEGTAFQDGSVELISGLLPRIQETTELALDFNDKYDHEEHTKELIDNLPRDLCKLGKAIGLRFEMEDQLIEVLHGSHKELVA